MAIQSKNVHWASHFISSISIHIHIEFHLLTVSLQGFRNVR